MILLRSRLGLSGAQQKGLEKGWEATLAERQRLGEEYDRFTAARPRTLTAAESCWPAR